MASLREVLTKLKKEVAQLQAMPTNLGTIPAEWLVKDEAGKFKQCPRSATQAQREMYATLVAMHKTMGTG